MGFIDCDSHVVECEDTWEYMDPGDQDYKPIKVAPRETVVRGAGNPFREIWLFHNTWAGFLGNDSSPRGNGNRFDADTTFLRDPSKRIEELDVLGIDVQMLYGTCFNSLEIDSARAEAAVKRSFNRWMGERLSDSKGRLVWALEVPTATMERAVQELKFGKEHGAAAVKMHAVEHGRYLDDPYFDPLYQCAQDLDLAIVVHVGRPTTQSAVKFPIGSQFPTLAPIVEHLASPMTAFHTVVQSDFEVRFPRLRFCITEAGSTWTTAILQQHARVIASQTPDFRLALPALDTLERKNIFVTCQTDEDLGYLTGRVLGENVLVVGTDYGHNDVSSDIASHETILARTDISGEVAAKIVDSNGRRAFGIDPAFRPTDQLSVDRDPLLPYTRAFETGSANARGVVAIGV